MPKIFITYRREDSLDQTGRIYDRLTGKFPPESIFRDVDNMPPGADFRGVLDRAVGRQRILGHARGKRVTFRKVIRQMTVTIEGSDQRTLAGIGVASSCESISLQKSPDFPVPPNRRNGDFLPILHDNSFSPGVFGGSPKNPDRRDVILIALMSLPQPDGLLAGLADVLAGVPAADSGFARA
jgi:hypothetical protein